MTKASDGIPVVVPQLGVNDDAVRILSWSVDAGAQVATGDVLAEIETSKATSDLEAEASGFFYPLVEAASMIPVQEVIGVILPEPDPDAAKRFAEEHSAMPSDHMEEDGPRLTAKARELAEREGVDVTRLPTDRIVREADVRAAIGTAPRAPSVDPRRVVAVYGAAAGGSTVVETLQAMGGIEIRAFLDDDDDLVGQERLGIPILAASELEALADRGIGAVAVAVSLRDVRLEIRDRVLGVGLQLASAIDPSAVIAPSARFGVGCFVKAGAVIGTATALGDVCLIDNGAIVPHDNVIGDGCHLAPGATLGSSVHIGARTLIGIAATVSTGISIGEDAIIAPGSVVVRDVPARAVVEGVPARILGERR